MKRTVGFLLAFFLIPLLILGQANEKKNDTDSRGKEFLIVRAKYNKKQSGITTELFIDIGDSKDHPLWNTVENLPVGVIKVRHGNTVKVLRNEVDMLQHFTMLGWEIIDISKTSILNASYTQYLFKK